MDVIGRLRITESSTIEPSALNRRPANRKVRALAWAVGAGACAAAVLALCQHNTSVPGSWWMAGLAGGTAGPLQFWIAGRAGQRNTSFLIDWALVYSASLALASIVLGLA